MTNAAQPLTDRPDPAVIAAQNDAFRKLACLGMAPYGIHTSFFGWQFQAYLFQCIELAFKDWTYELQFWRFWRPAS